MSASNNLFFIEPFLIALASDHIIFTNKLSLVTRSVKEFRKQK